MYRHFPALLLAGTSLIHSATVMAARPLGSHQPEPVVASPVSSGSPVGVPFIRNGTGPTISPGVGITAPTAFGADWGDVFLGLGGNHDTNSRNRSTDGSGYLGMGFGNAKTTVGLEATINLISISDDLFEEASMSFKLHRMLGDRTAIALGSENAVRHGDSVFPDESYEYLALSHVFALNENDTDRLMTVPITIGVGNGRFSELEPQNRAYSGDAEAFVAVGFIPHPRVSLLAEYLGKQFNAGVSWAPFRNYPLVVTAALLDLGEEYDDKADFGLALGYSFQFSR